MCWVVVGGDGVVGVVFWTAKTIKKRERERKKERKKRTRTRNRKNKTTCSVGLYPRKREGTLNYAMKIRS